jgi:hypothetical protein
MQQPESQKITKKFLRERMSMEQYNTARAHYGDALRQILEEDVPNYEPPRETRDTGTSEAVPASESISEPNATEDGLLAAKAKLRAEAAGWGIEEKEIAYILDHHPDLTRARNLLWQARRKQNNTTLMASAAD